MSRRKQLAIAGVFLLGAFCLVYPIVRLYYVCILVATSNKLLKNTGDPSPLAKLSDHNNLWAHIEAYTSTFTTCLRTLRSLTHGLTSVIGRIRSLLSRTKTTLRASDRACERKGADMLYQGSVENRKIDWYELQSEEANAEVHALPRGGDAEVMSFQSDSILVKKTFASQGT